MRFSPALLVLVALCCGSFGDEPTPQATVSDDFFQRLDVNNDGRVTLAEAPEKGKMLVEFLLRLSGKRDIDPLNPSDLARITRRHTQEIAKREAVEVALGVGNVQAAPENCAACAMGLTAEFVFKRLDVDQDKLVTVVEFMRSPGMDDEEKAREVVGRLDSSGDGKLSWKELKMAYQARHANCKKPDPATLVANARQVGPDGRGDGNRFAQVFILRSDQNGDGKISKDEFRGNERGFSRLDKNGDGFIEPKELGELHQRRLADPKTMKERLESGDLPNRPQSNRPRNNRPSGKPKAESE